MERLNAILELEKMEKSVQKAEILSSLGILLFGGYTILKFVTGSPEDGSPVALSGGVTGGLLFVKLYFENLSKHIEVVRESIDTFIQ